MIVSAHYKKGPLIGHIRISQVYVEIPTQFSMVLFHRSNGPIHPSKSSFTSVENAIGYAALYGFVIDEWVTVDNKPPLS
jgi:hypothetical protein